MCKLLYLMFFSLYFVMSLEAVVIQNYRGGPYSNYGYYPSSSYSSYQTQGPNYSPDDPRNPYNRSALYFNYNPFPDSDRHEQIFENNKR